MPSWVTPATVLLCLENYLRSYIAGLWNRPSDIRRLRRERFLEAFERLALRNPHFVRTNEPLCRRLFLTAPLVFLLGDRPWMELPVTDVPLDFGRHRGSYQPKVIRNFTWDEELSFFLHVKGLRQRYFASIWCLRQCGLPDDVIRLIVREQLTMNIIRIRGSGPNTHLFAPSLDW